jgi:NADPH-dependent ferric siderophore reductase
MLETSMDAMYGTVVRTEQLSPRMVRIVFGGEGLSSFASTGFTDEYVNAQFLPEDAPCSVPFDPETLKGAPREIQPRGRRETVRRWDPEAGELTLDIVTHGDEGFAGRFANRASEGDRLQMLGPSGGYSPVLLPH